MEDEQTRAAIIEKVRKLLAMARAKGTSPEEAASFAAKAQKWMQEYNLTRADVLERPLIDCTVFPYAGTRKWHKLLVATLAEFNFCKALQTKDNAYLFGEEHNVRFVRDLYQFLWEEAERLAQADYRSYAVKVKEPTHIATWKGNYYLGFCQAIGLRLRQQYEAAQAGKQPKEPLPTQEKNTWANLEPSDEEESAPDSGAKMRALIVIEQNAIQEKIDEMFPRVGKLKKDYYAPTSDDHSGYGQGVRAGKKVPLNKQLEEAEQSDPLHVQMV